MGQVPDIAWAEGLKMAGDLVLLLEPGAAKWKSLELQGHLLFHAPSSAVKHVSDQCNGNSSRRRSAHQQTTFRKAYDKESHLAERPNYLHAVGRGTAWSGSSAPGDDATVIISRGSSRIR